MVKTSKPTNYIKAAVLLYEATRDRGVSKERRAMTPPYGDIFSTRTSAYSKVKLVTAGGAKQFATPFRVVNGDMMWSGWNWRRSQKARDTEVTPLRRRKPWTDTSPMHVTCSGDLQAENVSPSRS
jgi:hypothetical protein